MLNPLRNLTAPKPIWQKVEFATIARACVVVVDRPPHSSIKNRDGVALSTLAVGRGDYSLMLFLLDNVTLARRSCSEWPMCSYRMT